MSLSFSLSKVGGSCLAKSGETVAAALAAREGKHVLVHGYSVLMRKILKEHGIERKKFVSASGVDSHFTSERELAASLLAASIEGERLAAAVRALGRTAHAVLGHRGLFLGERKRAIRYKEGGALRVYRDDLSGKVSGVELPRLEELLGASDFLIVGATLWDASAGALVSDADAVASFFARASGQKHYEILSDVQGFEVEGRVVREVKKSELEGLFVHAHGGMSKKLRYVQEALEGGVESVTLRNGASPNNEGTRFSCE